MSANNNDPWLGPVVDKAPDLAPNQVWVHDCRVKGPRWHTERDTCQDCGKARPSMDKAQGPTEDYLRGYSAGYDQALFDRAQGSNPITLRDKFAMAALTGFLAHGAAGTTKEVADGAYLVADFMITAREGKSHD